jgi:hypothetical protein
MKRLLLILTSSFFLLLSPMHASAITGGQVDTANRYPFVGLLAFYDAQGEYMHRCTGTLLSPTVVLTAAHCTDGTALVYAYFQITVPDDFREKPTGISGTPYTHPDFNPNTLDNDVGIVVLDQRVNLRDYPKVASEGFLTELKASQEIQDDIFVAVGYGVQTGFPPPNPDRRPQAPFLGVALRWPHAEQPPPPTESQFDGRRRHLLRRFGRTALLAGHAHHRFRDELGGRDLPLERYDSAPGHPVCTGLPC